MAAEQAPVARNARTGIAEKDHTEPHFSLDFKAWIKEQQQEIEDLKRAARGFSPSNSTSQGHDLSTRRSYDGDMVIGNIDGDGPDSSTALASAIPPPMSPLPPPAQPQHNALRADTRDGSGEKSLAYDNANDRSGGRVSVATLAPPFSNRMTSSVVPEVSDYGASPAVARFIEGSSTSRRTAWRDSTRCGGAFERDSNEKVSPCLQHEELPRAWHSPDDAQSAPSPRNIHDRFNIGSRSSGEKGDAMTEGMLKRQEARAGREMCAAEGRGGSTRGATAVAGVSWQGMAEEAEASWWAVDEADVVPSHAECRKSYRETSTSGGAHVATRAETSKAKLTGSSNSAAARPVWEGGKGGDSALVGGHWQVSGRTNVERCGDRFLVHGNRVVEGSRLDACGFGGGTCFRDLGGSCGAVKDSNIKAAKLEGSGFPPKERARANMPLYVSCLETARMEPLPREGLAQARTKLGAADSPTTLPANFSGSYPRCSDKKGRLPSTAIGGSREDLQPSQRVVLGGGSIDGSVFARTWSLGMKGSRGRRSVHSGAEGKSVSLADSLAARREEQSVLAKQLERELASTISVLREERRQRRIDTEAFRSRLEEAKAIVIEREAELERRGVMMKSIVSELEALQVRCDRLTASREKRTEEVEKAMCRLREDNRELEDRLRWAEAAAVEARAERDDARAEMERISKDLLSAKALATVAEHRAEEAEASLSKVTESAELHQKTLERSEEERECLRQEVEGLRKRLEQEGREGMVTSLKAQVGNLEEELVEANRRYMALEARLDMSREELTGEGGEEKREHRRGECIKEEGDRRPVEDVFDRDQPGRVDAVSCDVRKQEVSGLDRLSSRKENIAGRHNEGSEGNIDADGVNISVRGHGDRRTMDEYEELKSSRAKLALFPSGGRNRDTMGATSGDSARQSLLGSAGDHGVESRPHGLKLLRETLEKFNRASGEKGRIAIDAHVEGQAIAGMTSDQSGGKGVEPGRGMVAGCGTDQGVEGKEDGREDARNAARHGGKTVYPRDSVLACETEGDREKQGNCDNRRAAEKSVSSTYRSGREGPAFRGFDENGMADPGDFRGAPVEIVINKGSNSSCGSSSSPYREMLEYQSSSRGAGVIRHRTEDAAVDRPQTPAPNSMRPSTFTPERFERIRETRQEARRGLGISARQEGSYRGDGEEIVPSRRRKLQVHVPMAQKAQASKLQTSNAVGDGFTTSRKGQQNMTIPGRRRVSRATTDSKIIDRARNALANSRSTTVSVKRRSLGPSRASNAVSGTGVSIRSHARVLSRTSITPASGRGPRRLRSATLASSVQQQRQPRKTRVVQPRGGGKAESGGARVFGGPGICEGGGRGGDGITGRPQRDRDRGVRSTRVKTAPTSLRSETPARSGSLQKMGPTGSGRSKVPPSTSGMSNVPMASSSVASGSVRSTKLARESVSLMRKRRERVGMKSGGVSSNTEESSGVSGRNASGNRSGDAGVVARRDGGVASGRALVSSSGSRAWRP